MKKISLILVISLMLSLLCACGSSGAKDPGFDTVASKIYAAVGSDSLAELDAKYSSHMFNLEEGSCEECVVLKSNVGTSIDEYGVFKAKDTDAVAQALEAYIQNSIDTWMGYNPEELPKLENAEVYVQGDYVCYFILSDDARSAAVSAFESCFEG